MARANALAKIRGGRIDQVTPTPSLHHRGVWVPAGTCVARHVCWRCRETKACFVRGT